MQKYWFMREFTDAKQPERGIQRGYGFCEGAADAKAKCRYLSGYNKQTLECIWICYLESPDPSFALIHGQSTIKYQPLDNASKGMPDYYRRELAKANGEPEPVSKHRKNKPHIRVKNTPAVEETPRYTPYKIVMSNQYKKPVEEPANA